jgi:ATP-dependent exoDNAse (exonuclease V) alpha subunit
LQNTFALTIYKVQGLLILIITVFLDTNIFSNRQVYTAISWARQLEDIYIAVLDWSVFKVDQEAVKEYQYLEDISRSLPEL